MSDESNEALLQRIFKDEEDYMAVLSIRDELMENVFEECHKLYMKKQSVKFIVQCAYDAMVKYLSFEFYYHPEVPDINQSIWVPDKPIEASPKDTWAAGAVPIRRKSLKNEEEVTPELDEEEGEPEMTPSVMTPSVITPSILTKATSIRSLRSVQGFEPKCCGCLGHPCTCLITADISSKRFDDISEKAQTGRIKSNIKLSKHSLLAGKRGPGTDSKVILTKSTTKKEPAMLQSLPLISDTKLQVLEKPPAVLSEALEKPSGVHSGISEKAKVAPPKIREKSPSRQIHETEYLEDLLRSANASAVKLPAIRVQSTLQFKPISQPKKKN